MICCHPSKCARSLKRFLFLFGLVLLVCITLTLPMPSTDGEPTLEGWDRNRSRSLPLFIQPKLKIQLIEPTTLCKENSPILLLIIVSSAAENFQKRQTIRSTWANTTEFNYSKFSQMHSKFDGNYLPINYPDWKKFVVKNDLSSTSIDGNRNKSLDDGPSQANFDIRVVFLLGQASNDWMKSRIIEESRDYNDIIQENFIDSYNNLTLKSVMMLKWITNNCNGKVKFFMKCDDDAFVNVPNLIHILLGGTVPVYAATLPHHNDQTRNTLWPENRLEKFDNLLMGCGMCNEKPKRHSWSKVYAPRYMYNPRSFPKYLTGVGYVFTIDTAQTLYDLSMNVPLLHLEDVFLTGICAEKANLDRLHHPLFYYREKEDLCAFRGLVVIHEIVPSEMKKSYEFVINTNAICDSPSKNAPSRPRKVFLFWEMDFCYY